MYVEGFVLRYPNGLEINGNKSADIRAPGKEMYVLALVIGVVRRLPNV